MPWQEPISTQAAATSSGFSSFALTRKAKRPRTEEHPRTSAAEAGPAKTESGGCLSCDALLRWEHFASQSRHHRDLNPWRLSASLLQTLTAIEAGLVKPCLACRGRLATLREPASKLTSTLTTLSDTDEKPDDSPVKPAFAVWLFAYGFNITPACSSSSYQPLTELFPYDTTAMDFFQQLDMGRLPATVLKVYDVAPIASDGQVVVEVIDYRSHRLSVVGFSKGFEARPAVHRIRLRPSLETILPAVKKIQKMHSRNGQSGWSDGDWVGLERRILDTALPQICLDPSPLVFTIASSLNYHQNKMNILLTRPTPLDARHAEPEVSPGRDVDDDEEVDQEQAAEDAQHATLLNNPLKWRSFTLRKGPEDTGSSDLPMASAIGTKPNWNIPLVEDSIARVLKFSSTHVGSKCVEIHRREAHWGVLVKTESKDKSQTSSFWHGFHTFREANTFCEELKLQYVRMEQRTLLEDSLAAFSQRVESAVCMETVFGCDQRDEVTNPADELPPDFALEDSAGPFLEFPL
eukprot:m.133764 g.133764  ORF g.133764 m.133764 type:complete len:520 (+) comp13848_c0_seq1:88-1647(+)